MLLRPDGPKRPMKVVGPGSSAGRPRYSSVKFVRVRNKCKHGSYGKKVIPGISGIPPSQSIDLASSALDAAADKCLVIVIVCWCTLVDIWHHLKLTSVC